MQNNDGIYSLKDLDLVGESYDERLDNLTNLASLSLGVPIALVSIIDFENDRQYFKSHVGISGNLEKERGTPLSHSFCRHVQKSGYPLIVSNAREHSLVRDNPSIVDYKVIAYAGMPIHGADGNPIGALCAIQQGEPKKWSDNDLKTLSFLSACVDDVIQLRIALADKQRAYAIAERAVSARTEFVTHLSHELRTPLTSIIGAARLLGTFDLQEKPKTLAQAVERGTKRLKDLVDNVLDWSKLDAEQMKVDEHPFNAFELCQEVVSIYSHEACEKGVRLEAIDCTNLTCDFMLDRKLVGSIIHNLVKNALKFTYNGSVKLTVDVDTMGHTCFIVQDTGIGIPKERQDAIFDAFQQASSSNYETCGGTGLGLSITKRLVELMGGEIKIESQEGQGSTFTVALPLRKASVVAPELRNAEYCGLGVIA